MRFLLCLLLVACGDMPRKVLKEQGRPDPVRCVKTANSQETCTDGAGLIWTCGWDGMTDATCIHTGHVPKEQP